MPSRSVLRGITVALQNEVRGRELVVVVQNYLHVSRAAVDVEEHMLTVIVALEPELSGLG